MGCFSEQSAVSNRGLTLVWATLICREAGTRLDRWWPLRGFSLDYLESSPSQIKARGSQDSRLGFGAREGGHVHVYRTQAWRIEAVMRGKEV